MQIFKPKELSAAQFYEYIYSTTPYQSLCYLVVSGSL